MENEVIKNKYIALEEFEWNGETIEIDQIVELTDEEAADLLESGKIEVAPEETEEEEDDDFGDDDEDDDDFGDDDDDDSDDEEME